MHLLLCFSVYNEGLYVHLRGFVFLYFKKDHFDLIKQDHAT